jgi:prepilin signal peptidase PulO-like enzyme (type II secretory pathway)
MLNALFAIIGLSTGGVINLLADDLPARVRPRVPHCSRCSYVYGPGGWLALGRLILGGSCPQCGLPTRRRAISVEIGTVVLFATLPWLITPTVNLVIYSIYIAVLILVIVIDLEHRLILHVVTFPTTAFALIGSFLLTDNSLLLAIAGAVAGFIFFYLAYLLGRRLFGPGALGFGDVTLATMMGAMLGFQRIFFALILGILLAGIFGLIALASRRASRRTYFPYGPFLATGGITMIIWGDQIYHWVTGT